MSRARTIAPLVLLAGLAACDLGDARHNYPDEKATEETAGTGTTLQDSLVTGEAIQTAPPPVDDAQPTATATGDTLQP